MLLAKYEKQIRETHGRILKKNVSVMNEAAEQISQRILSDRLLYVLGPGGHSSMAAEEIFYRAGGLVQVAPMLEPALQLFSGARKTTLFERIAANGSALVKAYGIENGDVIVISNVAGINAMSIEAALSAKDRGALVISISSHEWADSVGLDHPARHDSGLSLHQVSDIAIDLGIAPGDGTIHIGCLDECVGPVSTQAVSFVLQGIVLLVLEKLSGSGVQPLVWKSSNVKGGDAANAEYFLQYSSRIRHL